MSVGMQLSPPKHIARIACWLVFWKPDSISAGLEYREWMNRLISLAACSAKRSIKSISGSSTTPLPSTMFPTPPQGYLAHQESTTQILTNEPVNSDHHLPSHSDAFINPVQEYNRDLSIAAIRAWSAINSELITKKLIHPKSSQIHPNPAPTHPLTKKLKLDSSDSNQILISLSQPLTTRPLPLPTTTQSDLHPDSQPPLHPQHPSSIVPTPAEPHFTPPKFTALEALSATGLRAIRYAKEIPSLKWIIANDLSPSAVKAIKANIAHNQLEPESPAEQGRVRVNQGDACDLMYSHRAPSRQFHVVDLDPYGSAAPFMDAAVQCVRDGGLLCVTCTDLAVLAGSAYPEKCFSNYGGSSMRAEYSHEYALRQVLHALASSAGRYGRQIEPLLSLSIDFYVRIFVRVSNAPAEVKKLITNTALVYVCVNCSAHHLQPLGRSSSKPTKSGAGTNVSYHNSAGPPMAGAQCEECGGRFHVAGPLWSGPLHERSFAERVLEEAGKDEVPLKTAARIKGMVGIAKMELADAPFFFTPTKLSGLFHCSSPPLTTVASAILNAGYRVSRSHCQPGSIKTDAPRSFLHDVMRKWVESNPVKMSNVKDGSPSAVVLAKAATSEVSLEWNPRVEKEMMTDVKVVRYQSNPMPNWGPKARAKAR